jgi:hypothetical protein
MAAGELMTGEELSANGKVINLGGPGEGYADTWIFRKSRFCRTWKGLDQGKEVCQSWKTINSIATAVALGCKELMSEDMAHGREVETVRIVNPFK